MKRFIGFVIALLLPLLTMAQEKYYGESAGEKLDWAMYYLNEYYVDSVDTQVITDAAMRAIAAQLDPYSVYQSAEELRKQRQNDDGTQFIGIGVTLLSIDFLPRVTSIVKGSAAEISALAKGDIIKEVNGATMYQKPINEVLDLLQGNPGTEVNLLIQRGEQTFTKQLQRARVPLISVETSFMLTKSIGYIKMIKFTQKTVEEFKNAYSRLTAAGMESLVLDLRGNNGGVFNAATGLSALFLDEGNLISYTDGVISEREDHICAQRGDYADGKVVLLTDGVTASASEVFSGSMQDWDRALIVGAPTFGKGLIQQSYGFSDSSAIRLTISKYYRPTGRAVQNPGNDALVFPSDVFVGSETSQFMSAGYTATTMSGRKIYTLGAGVSPDVYYPTDWYDGTSIPYKYVAEYFFNNQSELTRTHYNLHGLLASSKIDSYIRQREPSIDDRDLAEVKAWLAALILGKDAYYETVSTHDSVIKEAIKRIGDGSFERLGVRY